MSGRQMRDGLQIASTGGDLTPSTTVIPFPLRGRGRPEAVAGFGASGFRFTASDHTALIALGYALANWEIAFEDDAQGMQWAALCPPAENGTARYVVGRDGGVLALLSGSGEVLGRYATGAELVQDIRRWEAATPVQHRDLTAARDDRFGLTSASARALTRTSIR